MNRKEYFEFHREFCEEMFRITEIKNKDYATNSSDPFSNFRKIEQFTNGAVTAEAGFLTRMSDKYSRLCSFVKNGELAVKDESVTDSLIDLANYCVLFAGYLQSKKQSSVDDFQLV